MQARTIIKQHQFLENFISCGRNVSQTCKKVGVSRWTFYEWKKTDVDFLMDLLIMENRNVVNKRMLAEVCGKWMYKGVGYVCELCDLSRWTYYNWKKNDEAFNELLEAEYKKEDELREARSRERERMWMESWN